jgi:hypothetical protein
MTEDGIVGIDHGCGQNAEQLVDFHQLTDAIVAPPEVRTS